MSFNNWPLEILLQLLNGPVLRQHDLSSLSQVDKRFHEVASPLLYRDIKLDSLIDAGLRLRFWKRAFDENPSLGPYLRSLLVDWTYDQHNASRLRKDLRYILKNAPLLEAIDLTVQLELEQQYPGARYDPPAASIKYCVHDVTKIMFIPKLRKLFIPIIDNDSWGLRDLQNGPNMMPQRPTDNHSSVRVLHMGPHAKPSKATEELLRWPGGLEELRYDLGQYIGSPHIEFPTLSRMLAPHTDTLLELHLSGYNHDGLHLEKINFASFPKLKILVVTQVFLFPTTFDDDGHETQELEPRNGLYRRLPGTLESLEIFFDYGTAILDHTFSSSGAQIKEDYDWISELAENKEEHYPSLKGVAISEHHCYHTWSGEEHDPELIKRWNTPSAVERVFQEKGVKLDVWVRMWYRSENEKEEDDEWFNFIPSQKRGMT